jgi:hypothetical protein
MCLEEVATYLIIVRLYSREKYGLASSVQGVDLVDLPGATAPVAAR